MEDPNDESAEVNMEVKPKPAAKKAARKVASPPPVEDTQEYDDGPDDEEVEALDAHLAKARGSWLIVFDDEGNETRLRKATDAEILASFAHPEGHIDSPEGRGNKVRVQA